MKQPRLIGIYASAPGSGKTTVANYLSSHYNFAVISFATPLKRMVAGFLNSHGYNSEEIEELLTVRKNEVLPELKISPRQLMQTLGNEWGRECISNKVWLQAWEKTADRYLALGINVVCDDVRYENEANLIQKKGGELWRLDRIQTGVVYPHSSEGRLDDFIDWDCVLKNNETEFELQKTIFGLLNPLPV